MAIKLKASVLLGALALSSNTHQVKGHAVELLSCLTTTGKLRIFVRHWHNNQIFTPADAGAMVISGTGIVGSATLVADGFKNNVVTLNSPWNDLFVTGCSSAVALHTSCSPFFSLAQFNDYVWYDFPTECDDEVKYTFESGTTVVLMDGCPNAPTPLYPTTITSTYTDITAPLIFINGLSCSTTSIVLNALTKDCKYEAQVRFRLSTEDDCDSSPTITSTHSSGDFFPVGSTVVTVTSTDSAGHISTCTFTVVVTRDPELCGECLGCSALTGILTRPEASGSLQNPCNMGMNSMTISARNGRCYISDRNIPERNIPERNILNMEPPFSRKCYETNCDFTFNIRITLKLARECLSACTLVVYDDSEQVFESVGFNIENVQEEEMFEFPVTSRPKCECRSHRIKAVFTCPGWYDDASPSVLTQMAEYTCSECEKTPLVG